MSEMTDEKACDDVSEAVAAGASRDKVIVRTSVIGIAANFLLAGVKAVIGLLAHSIAIVLDAVNNLSDAGSSVITIIGAKYANKPADKKHPFGHGRAEYLSAMIISVIVLYAGITSLVESVKKIITPETPDYSAVTLVIIGIAVAVKLVLGRYVKGVGQKVDSDSLINSGEDALMDALISLSTLAAAVIYLIWHLPVEAWLGAVISLIIVKSGVDMLRETLSRILGESGDAELARAIKATVCSFPDVSGAYDLVLNDYGPERFNGSIHIEVPDTYSADALDELIRQITVKVYQEHRVLLTAVGVYSINTKDPNAIKMRDDIREIVLGHEYVREMHGFFVNEEKKIIRFDAVISFDAKDRRAVYEHIRNEIAELYPDYTVEMALDTDFSEA